MIDGVEMALEIDSFTEILGQGGLAKNNDDADGGGGGGGGGGV